MTWLSTRWAWGFRRCALGGAPPSMCRTACPCATKPVRHQHPMAMKPDPFGAHAGGARLLRQVDQFGGRLFKLWCQHVIGVVPKAGAAQGDVGRVVANLLAKAAQGFHPDVSHACLGHGLLERLTIETWQATRDRERPDVRQYPRFCAPARQQSVLPECGSSGRSCVESPRQYFTMAGAIQETLAFSVVRLRIGILQSSEARRRWLHPARTIPSSGQAPRVRH